MKTAKLRKIALASTLALTLVSCKSESTRIITQPSGSSTPSSSSAALPVPSFTPSVTPTPAATPAKSPTPDNQGVRTGSGGDGVACYDDQGKLENVYLWDFIEAEYRNGYTLDLGSEDLTVKEKFNLVLERIFKKIKGTNLEKKWREDAEAYLGFLEGKKVEYLNSKMVSFINKGITSNPKVNLKDLKDLRPDIDFSDKKCKMVQLAKQEKEFVVGSPLLFIDDYYYSRMSNDHKAGLLIHEFILIQINMAQALSDKDTTFPARNLTALASSLDFKELNPEAMELMLSQSKLIEHMDFQEDPMHGNSGYVSGYVLAEKNFDDEWKRFTGYTNLNIYTSGIINEKGESIIIDVEASEVSIYKNQISSFGFSTDKSFRINSLNDENNSLEIPVKSVESNLVVNSDNGETYAEPCEINLQFGVRGDGVVSRDLGVNCLGSDMKIKYNDQEITFAKNGRLGLSYAHNGLSYVKSGTVYGGQTFQNPNGEIVKIGTTGTCTAVYVHFALDDAGKPSFNLQSYDDNDECPILKKAE